MIDFKILMKSITTFNQRELFKNLHLDFNLHLKTSILNFFFKINRKLLMINFDSL